MFQSSNVFQRQDTHLTCDTYVGSMPHFNFFLNSKIFFMCRKSESSSFDSFAPVTETDIAFMLVQVYFCTKSFFLRILNKQFGSQAIHMYSVLPRPFLQGATPCPFLVTPCLF